MIATTINVKLSDVIMKDYQIAFDTDDVMEAGIFIIERGYVNESPGDTGNLKQEIKPKKLRALEYVVESRAKTKGGKPYPLFLFTGTGKMKGMPDFGFTTGRVRTNDVAYGIGGIRPNKAAIRTINKVKDDYIQFVKEKLYKKI